MDYVIAGTAAAMAGAICNPLEVVKIRMQLQGELKAKGHYAVHYRNVFHAFYTIGTKDGIVALQKGLVPFTCYHFTVSGVGRGLFQVLSNKGWTKDAQGRIHGGKTFGLSIMCGAIGGFACSPFYLVKTHLQSKANEVSIAVGHQHQHLGMIHAFKTIFKQHGIPGLWRGTTSQIPRIAAAGAGQMTGFEVAYDYMKRQLPGQVWVPLGIASLVSGLFTTTIIAPFDIIATRFFNQGTDKRGKGLMYKNVIDCASKIYKSEGLPAFFKGWTAIYFRLGPYTMFLMVFWDRMKFHYAQYSATREIN